MASEARFRQLADTMPQIVWTARPDGYWTTTTNAGMNLPASAAMLSGMRAGNRILHPEDLQRTRETWYAAVHSGEPYNIEYRFLDRRENRWRWFMGRALPVRDAAGQNCEMVRNLHRYRRTETGRGRSFGAPTRILSSLPFQRATICRNRCAASKSTANF